MLTTAGKAIIDEQDLFNTAETAVIDEPELPTTAGTAFIEEPELALQQEQLSTSRSFHYSRNSC